MKDEQRMREYWQNEATFGLAILRPEVAVNVEIDPPVPRPWWGVLVPSLPVVVIGGCCGMVVLLAYAQARERERFMQECRKYRSEYECVAMSGRLQSAPYVAAPIIIPRVR